MAVIAERDADFKMWTESNENCIKTGRRRFELVFMPCDPNNNAPDWCKCKFPVGALHGKSVHFKLRTEKGIEAGKGKLAVEPGNGGYVRAAVQFLNQSTVTFAHKGGAIMAEGRLEWIGLNQSEVDAIIQNPPGSECEFSVIAV